MVKSANSSNEEIRKRLDLIAATLLAMSGLTEKQIAEVLDVSEKTIERMFSGNLNRVRSIQDARVK